MAVQSGATTTISISAAQPATFDATGYAAVTGWGLIGEVTSMSPIGKTFAEITHSPIASRMIQKLKGSINIGNQTMNLAIDPADAGQIIAQAALDSDDDYSFKVVYPSGDIRYYQGKVMQFDEGVASTDALVAGTLMVALTGTKTGVGIVRVAAP